MSALEAPALVKVTVALGRSVRQTVAMSGRPPAHGKCRFMPGDTLFVSATDAAFLLANGAILNFTEPKN